MYFSLKISSKNKNSLESFLFFISKIKIPIIIGNYPQHKKKKFLTVLRSPHVNKTAQEQFEFKVYSRKLVIQSSQHKMLLIFLKKIIKSSFPGLTIQVCCSIVNKKPSLALNALNPNLINTHFFTKITKNSPRKYKKIIKHLNLFDSFGESFLFSRM